MAVPSLRATLWERRPRASGTALASALTTVLWLLWPGLASAHAHLLRADPAPGSVVAHAPALAVFTFDEALNPTLTRVSVANAAGQTVAAGPGHLAPGPGQQTWVLPLPRLSAGTYSVYWTSESAVDGHVMSSFYTFQVAAAGRTGASGPTTGPGKGGAAGGLFAGLSGGAWATALVHWAGLMAQALWLGALLVEVAVLRPARRRGVAAEQHLAALATPRLWGLVRGALAVTALALTGEEVSLALQGSGGDWGRALAPATLGGMLSSTNGHLVVARGVLALVSLALAGAVPVAGAAALEGDAGHTARPRAAGRHALGIVAPPPARLAPPQVCALLTGLATLYMGLVAFSGHAAAVSPVLLWCGIDMLHLLGTAAWAGGIAALAWGVLPLRHALSPDQRAPAVPALLDRFSPLAYGAVGLLTLSGLFNAVAHLHSPAAVTGTLYGQVLIAKGALVGLLLLLSAEHTYLLRPRIARRQRAALTGTEGAAAAVAAVHEGLATLAGRLRLEGYVGAGVLLATALLSQTLPAAGSRGTPTMPAAPAGPAYKAAPIRISGTAMTGTLRGTLSVAPPAVGTATFTMQLMDGRTPLTGGTAAVIIHLAPAGRPTLQETLDLTGQGAGFVAQGSLASAGRWQASVLVRAAAQTRYRTLRYTFMVGPGAAFVTTGGRSAGSGGALAPGVDGHDQRNHRDGWPGRRGGVVLRPLRTAKGFTTYEARCRSQAARDCMVTYRAASIG